jgi:predicted NAD-dependent protein-ADP-ribosyltransferase YbiA (DUF1768 family)
VDIKSGASYPSNALSNFAPHKFVFDGVHCASMEGFLQALKFEDVATQREVCGLIGKEAKARGRERNDAWQSTQTLWWNGYAYPRDSEDYQALLDRAYAALGQNSHFQQALLATESDPLTHSIGEQELRLTVLTEYEFVSRLLRIREELQQHR